jgi:hypothetical protein
MPLSRPPSGHTLLGGKTRAIAILAVYLATLCEAKLSPGETAVVLCISMSREQASYALNYAYATLEDIPILSKLIAFVDPSGGAADSFTLAIAHMEGKTAVLDVIRELRAPFSPEAAVEQYCLLLRQYSINTVRGDGYGGLWPQEQFSKRGITYEPSERLKSQIYQDLLPLVNSRGCALLDHEVMKRQL